MEIDLQQRGVEFSQLFRKHSGMRAALLEPMPPMEKQESQNLATENLVNGADNDNAGAASESLLGGISIIGNENDSKVPSLLDILDTPAPSTNGGTLPEPGGGGGGGLLDLLGDLDLSATPNNPPAPTNPSLNILDGLSTPAPTQPVGVNSLDDLLNNVNNVSKVPSFVGYNKNDISITFQCDRPSPSGLIVMNLNIVNTGSIPVQEFYLQAAVPKSMQLEILAAPKNSMEAHGGSISQVLKVNNPNKAVLKMRLKLAFNRDGQALLEQGEVSNFPPDLMN